MNSAECLKKYLRNLDRILSPPANFANYTYLDRLAFLWKQVLLFKGGPQIFRNGLNFLRFGTMILLSYLFIPLAYILKIAGYKFVDIDLSQIGSILYLDLYLRDDKLGTKTAKNKILILASYYFDGNKYILDLYNEHVVFVRNPVLKFLLSPFFMSPLFAGASFRFDPIYFTEQVTHRIWNEYLDRENSPLIKFPENDKAKAAALLEKYLPANQKFVPIHVRDVGFYQNKAQNTRNADINTYKAGIKYLIEQGYAVVRMGDRNMVSIDPLIAECGSMFFDYAMSDIKSEMMDCYLMSQCEFFVGLSSGPGCIPPLFGLNTVNVNWVNAAIGPYFMQGDLTTFKKIRRKSDNTLVSLRDLVRPPFSLHPTRNMLEQQGYILEDNSEEEIRDTLKEFIERRGEVPTPLQSRAKAEILPSNWAFGARGDFSNTILEKYFNNKQ